MRKTDWLNGTPVARALAASLLLASRGALAADPPQAPPASSQPGNVAAADQLFQEGRQAMQLLHFEEARTKFEASQKLDPAAGTQLNIAECLEKTNKLASASAMYAQAKEAATRRKRADWVQLATERIAALAPRLPKVRISGALPPKAKLELDAAPFDRGEGDMPIPVDPGPHRLTVVEGSRETFATTFTALEGSTSTVTLDLPQPLRAVPGPTETAPPPTTPPGPSAPPTPVDSSHGPSPFTWVFAGASVGAVAVGSVLLGVRSGQISKMNDVPCVPNMSLAKFQECQRLEGEVSSLVPPVIAFAAGGAFAVSAVVLYFATSGPRSAGTASKRTPCLPTFAGGACTFEF